MNTLMGFPVVVTDDAPKLEEESIVIRQPRGPLITSLPSGLLVVETPEPAPPTHCERCGRADCLERSGTLRAEGDWLCHDCEGDARMEE